MGTFGMKSTFFLVFYAFIIASQDAVSRPSPIPMHSFNGMLTKELPAEPAYRVRYYDLHVEMDTMSLVVPPGRSRAVLPIRGRVGMHLEWQGSRRDGQIHAVWPKIEFDAGQQIVIDSVFIDGRPCRHQRRGGRVFVDAALLSVSTLNTAINLTAYFHSELIPAVNPPWKDGVVVATDSNERPWLGMTCQTSGASSWWPCMDRRTDEPDSVRLTFDLPDRGAVLVTNGHQWPAEPLHGDRIRYRSVVSNPINLYNITFNIGHYESFKLPYRDPNGVDRSLEFHMLEGGVEQAKAYFVEAQTMMQGFEALFGPFAFWRDGYKVVETPYWGMEHQSCVAYGNKLTRNQYGFDFILVHESAHEWWGNAVSACRPHDLWIHEGLATWSESRLLEWRYPDSLLYIDYMMGLRDRIQNQQAVAAKSGTHKRHLDTDIYYKAAWMWHSLRHSLPSKARFDEVLQQFYQQYIYKNLDTRALTDFWCKQLGGPYEGFFNHYLRKKHLPILVCDKIGVDSAGVHTLKVRYKRVSKEFHMGIDLGDGVISPHRRINTIVQVRGDLERMSDDLKRKYLIEVQLKNHPQ